MRARDIISEAWHWRNKNKIYNLLVNSIDSGPFDGGCVIFAQALQIIYGGEVYVLVGHTVPNGADKAQHAVLLLDNKMIDADGPAPIEDFIKRFERNELEYSGGEILSYRPIQAGDLPNAPRDLELSKTVADLLKKR